MRSEKEEELLTIKRGLYGLITMVALITGVYYIAVEMKDTKKPSQINCYAVQSIFNDLEKDVKKYKSTGFSSITARKHNSTLSSVIETAKTSNCFTQNLKRIDQYLRLTE